MTYWDFQYLSIEELVKKYIEKNLEEELKRVKEQGFSQNSKKTSRGVKCPTCGNKLTENELFKGYCPKCYFYLSDDFIKQQEERKKNEEYQKEQGMKEKIKKELEKKAENIKPEIIKIQEKIRKGELLRVEVNYWEAYYNPEKQKAPFVCKKPLYKGATYVYKEALYEFYDDESTDEEKFLLHKNDDEYTDEEKLLLILELEDKERQKFESLKRKFELAQEIEKTPKRERIPEEVRIAVWRRDGGKCAKCGSRKNLEYDHIIPLSKGGSNTVRNIELLCEECNRKKRDKIE